MTEAENIDILEDSRLTESVVDVRVVNEHNRPEFGGGFTVQFLGTAADAMQQLCGQQPKRHRAVITAMNPTGVAGFVLVGSFEQVGNGQGVKLLVPANGSTSLTLESQSAVFVMSDKAVATAVSVWDERYR